MLKYRFMYDTGFSATVSVGTQEEARELANKAGPNLMFWYLEESASATS